MSTDNYNKFRPMNWNTPSNLNWTSNNTNIDNQELFTSVTLSYNEIVKKVRVRSVTENDNREFWHKIKGNSLKNSINEQKHRKFGRCYTFYPDSSLLKLGVYYIEVYL